jgi:hypothetical protein
MLSKTVMAYLSGFSMMKNDTINPIDPSQLQVLQPSKKSSEP